MKEIDSDDEYINENIWDEDKNNKDKIGKKIINNQKERENDSDDEFINENIFDEYTNNKDKIDEEKIKDQMEKKIDSDDEFIGENIWDEDKIEEEIIKNQIEREIDSDDEYINENIWDEWKNNKDKIEEENIKIKNKELVKNQIERENLKKKYSKKEETYYFLTINPNECEIKDLEKIIKKLKKKCWMEIYSYVFEQRGITYEDKGKQKHIHMIIKNNKVKTEIIREIHSSIKEYCEKENIDMIKMNENGKQIREKYMKGEIITQDKMELVKMDKIWRKENKLKDIYILNKEINEKFEELGFQSCKKFLIETINNKKIMTLVLENEEELVYEVNQI